MNFVLELRVNDWTNLGAKITEKINFELRLTYIFNFILTMKIFMNIFMINLS